MSFVRNFHEYYLPVQSVILVKAELKFSLISFIANNSLLKYSPKNFKVTLYA